MEPFVVKHYSDDERPTIKGNGFDGLEIGETREEAEVFVSWVNAQRDALRALFGVLFAVEQAVRNGCAPFEVEAAFDEYERAQSTPQPADPSAPAS